MTTAETNFEAVNMCDRALIYDIKLAVEVEQLPVQFSTADIAEWMEKNQVKRVDGTTYPPISLELLVNYSRSIPITKKRKQKVLYANLDETMFSFTPF